MIHFTEVKLNPTLEFENLRQRYEVQEKIYVTMNEAPLVVIPAGFKSDGMSIPFWARGKWQSWGKYTNAALLHDFLLLHSDLPKWQVDCLFYIALRDCGVSSLEAHIFYLAVRTKRSRT